MDPEVCSPGPVLQISPALFNAVCCVSAPYCFEEAHIIAQVQKFAAGELAKFPTEKSLGWVQAQIIYLSWAPCERFDLSGARLIDGICTVPRKNGPSFTWIRIGLLLRVAIDLDLHRYAARDMDVDATPESRASAVWLRRAWLMCTMLERIASIQIGKPSFLCSLHSGKEVAELPGDSLRDRRLFAQDAFLRFLECCLGSTGMLLSVDAGCIEGYSPSESYERLLEWRRRAEAIDEASVEGDEEQPLQQARITLSFNYGQLVVASIELDEALRANPTSTPFALAKYQAAALAVLNSFQGDWVAAGFARCSVDLLYSWVMYATVSLLKSIRPQFCDAIMPKASIGRLVADSATLLEATAQSRDHLPFLQAKLICYLLSAVMAEIDQSQDRLHAPFTAPAPFTPEALEKAWSQNNFCATSIGRCAIYGWGEFTEG